MALLCSTIMKLLHEGFPPERLTLCDTAKTGRPDTVALVAETYARIGAEVVFVTR